jgi:murein DD-endopeptidase MepM/ murein hydrolase activator NlpD
VTSHAPDSAVPRARSPRRARMLLVSAFATGLAGLAVAGGGGGSTVSAIPVATVIPLYASAPVVVTPVAAAPRVVALRADRTRALPVKKAPAKAAPKKVLRASARWVRPSYAGVVSPYGHRWGRQHKGIDFGDDYGSPIRAIGDGVVVASGYQGGESGYGKITIIRHSNGFYSAYAHQSRLAVQSGERVSAGEVIGYVGSSGNVTGPHLHFEIRTAPHGGQVNPVPWLREHGVRI